MFTGPAHFWAAESPEDPVSARDVTGAAPRSPPANGLSDVTAPVPWPALSPAADGAGVMPLARLAALREALADLATADGARAIPPVALRAALRVTGADDGSFWRATDAGFECHLAEGPDAAALTGRMLPAAEALGADDSGATLVAPLAAAPGASPFAALRVHRAVGDEPSFGAAERELLDTVAAAAAASFVADARLRRADRGADVALLAELSREIASTLDLDRVLRLAVNLAARAVTFDRGVLALYEQGQCDVRAVAGTEAVDAADPAMRDVAARGAWAAGTGEGFYLSDREAPGSDAERIFVQIFGDDLAAAGVASGLYLPLRDEEGVLGVLVLEAAEPDFADPRQRELADILVAQATVAIRNARLYEQVPLAATLGAVNARRRALLELPRRRRALVAGLAVLLLAALTLVRWPLRVVGEGAVFRPLDASEARTAVDGVVERVLVAEGARVRRGAPLVRLRDVELRAARDAVAAEVEADEREAVLAASRGDAARERLLRLQAESRRREQALLDERLRHGVVRAAVDGVVLTSRPEERVGARVASGETLLRLGRTDTLELEFGVRQQDLARVRPGQPVRLRIDALPGRTFTGRLTSLAELPADSGATPTFPVRALVANADGLLRPGMAAHARVLTDPASTAERLLRRPVRAARLLWWRIRA